LEETVIALYKALLLYQMKSVCSYYKNKGLVFLRALANMDDWDDDLKNVKDAEVKVQADAHQYTQEHSKTALANLFLAANAMETGLAVLHQDLQEFISLQKEMQQDEKDAQCLRDLFIGDPQYDMKNIEKRKDDLLDDAFQWILHTEQYKAFANWGSDQTSSCRLLWIKGPAGTGKTMLMIGIIRELTSLPAMFTPRVSHFFCQGTNDARNNVTATLRSLLWLLLVQQPHLIRHLHAKYRNSGSSLFTDSNASFALSDAFQSMLKDPDLSPTYLVVDALDECQDWKDLNRLISTSLSISDKVKWLVSSRPDVKIGSSISGLLALDAQILRDPVDVYIQHKLSALKNSDDLEYDDDILDQLEAEVRGRANNIFLWVALAFQQLEQDRVQGWDAIKNIQEMPEGLSKLYNQMITKVEKLSDWPYCQNVLAATSLAYRPLSFAELALVAGLPKRVNVRTVVAECGSFYTVEEDRIFLIHQSAKDYLGENYTKIQPGGVVQGHIDIIDRSINAMSAVLRKDIYSLGDYGLRPADALRPDPDPLASLQYSCLFWIEHICNLNEGTKCGERLIDSGRVFGFLQQHFLHWLESLSLLKKLPDGIMLIKRLLRLAQVY
jgi:hypothetical protein